MSRNPSRPAESPATGRVAAAAIGVLLAILALSNLVQGAWLPFLPWLNVTLFAPPALVLLILAGLPGSRKGRPGGLLLIAASFLPGYLASGLNPGVPEKRVAILLAVLMPLTVAYFAARSPRILNGFAVGTIGLASIVLAAQWLNPDPHVLALGRRTPDNLNAIGVGRALGLAVLVCLVLAIRSIRRPTRLFAWITLAGIFGVGASAAASRGPLAGLVVGVVAVLLASVQLSRIARTALIVLAMGAIAFAVRDFAAEGSRLVTSGDSGRAALFSTTLAVAMDNFAGIGWGNLYNYLPAQLVSGGQGYNQYPHNVLLEMLVAGGWLALGLFLFGLTLAGMAAFRCSQQLPQGTLVWGTFLYALTGAMFSSDVVGNRLLWVICAVSLGIWTRSHLAKMKDEPRRRTRLTRGSARRGIS